MSVELWKAIFDWSTVVLIALTVFSGAGALLTGYVIDKRQEARLRAFEKQLTEAKTALSQQEERTAIAEKALADLQLYNTPRWINLPEVSNALKGFAGTEFMMSRSWFPEHQRISELIQMALLDAGWKTKRFGHLPMDSDELGIEVSSAYAPDAGVKPAIPAARAVFEVLSKQKYLEGELQLRDPSGTAAAKEPRNIVVIRIGWRRFAYEPPATEASADKK
jgi:hypothetical protein